MHRFELEDQLGAIYEIEFTEKELQKNETWICKRVYKLIFGKSRLYEIIKSIDLKSICHFQQIILNLFFQNFRLIL